MKNFTLTTTIAAVALALGIAGVAQAQYTPGAGLAASPHDFSSAVANTETVGLCTFCHTPHRAISTRLIWNHKLSSNNYTWDETTTMGGTDLPTNIQTWVGPTRACLSCHDGSVAIGDVAWFNKAGPTVINATKHENDAVTVGAGGDMSGNHPVAVPIPFGNTGGETYNNITTGDDVVMEWVADPTTNGIRLFRDSGDGSAIAGPEEGNAGIECSSCHDPHNASTVQGPYLLRGELDGSTGGASGYICLKCHAK